MSYNVPCIMYMDISDLVKDTDLMPGILMVRISLFFQCFTRTAEQKRRKFPPSQKEIQCLTERSVPYTSLHIVGLLLCPISHLSNLNIDDNVLI